jgi:arginine deiminase
MLQIHSETGRLRRVLVHEPGVEVDRMVPDMMEELLFDDILFGERARDEHRRLRKLLEVIGVETVDMRDLLEQTLESPEAREWLFSAVLEDVAGPLAERMLAASPGELAEIFVGGARSRPTTDQLATTEDIFDIYPAPNWCFQRDPQVVVGDGVIFSAMATPTRARETLLSRTVFRFHPEYAETPVLLDPLQASVEKPLYIGMNRPCFEGGDIMVLSEQVMAVGYSERTNRSGVRQLVQALTRCEGGPRWLIVAALPHKRAYMHLDTVLTQIDRDECLAFAPVILPGHDDTAGVFEFDLHDPEPRPRLGSDLLTALRGRGVDLKPVLCGGDDLLDQQREQWTDGANALAVAPGVIVIYERNVRTVEALDGAGYRILDADEVIEGKAAVDLDAPGKTCVILPSNEISRARGGPHCLTHGLVRDRLS